MKVVDHFVTFSSAEERLTSGKPRETAIPPSIPYSGYLNRYSVKRAAAPSGRSYGFFHPYLPPPQTRFEALKVYSCNVHTQYDASFTNASSVG